MMAGKHKCPGFGHFSFKGTLFWRKDGDLWEKSGGGVMILNGFSILEDRVGID
jgi:hypothetical protein